jgi:hypothetical protein
MVVRKNKRHSCVKCEPEQMKGTGWLSEGNKRHNCVKCEPEQLKGTRWLSEGIRETDVFSVNLSR